MVLLVNSSLWALVSSISSGIILESKTLSALLLWLSSSWPVSVGSSGGRSLFWFRYWVSTRSTSFKNGPLDFLLFSIDLFKDENLWSFTGFYGKVVMIFLFVRFWKHFEYCSQFMFCSFIDLYFGGDSASSGCWIVSRGSSAAACCWNTGGLTAALLWRCPGDAAIDLRSRVARAESVSLRGYWITFGSSFVLSVNILKLFW